MSDEVDRRAWELLREKLGDGLSILTLPPGGNERVVGVTYWRDCLVIATTTRVMLYGPDGTLQTMRQA